MIKIFINPNKSSSKIKLTIILFTVFVSMMGYTIIIPILPRYAERLGATSFQIGLIIGLFSLAQFIMMPIWGNLSDRFGRKPMLLLSVFGSIIGYLIIGTSGYFYHSISMIIIGRIIDGGSGGIVGIAQAYINDITSIESRSRTMGLLGASVGLGIIFGPALGGIISYNYSFSLAMFIAAVITLFNFMIIFLILPESTHQKIKKSFHKFTFLKDVDKKLFLPAVLTFFLYNIGIGIITTSFALFLYHHYNFTQQETGAIYTMIGLIAVIMQGHFYSIFSKRQSYQSLISIGLILMSFGLFLAPITHHIEIIVAICIMNAFAQGLIEPSLPSMTAHAVKKESSGAAFGFFQSFGSLGLFCGPLLAGYCLSLDAAGPSQNYARIACWVAAGIFFIGSFAVHTTRYYACCLKSK